MQPTSDVVTMGHAIVDVLAPSEDALIARLGLDKGTMTLVDDDRAEEIYANLGPTTEMSGGSAANTAAGLASLGASVGFVGKVRADTLGGVFTHDIRAAGVHFPAQPEPEGPPTGRSLVLVTPDAEKTMCTNLGIGALIGRTDVDADLIGSARVLYIEGYLYGLRPSDEAVERAVAVAREAGTLVALSLSDPSWVELQGAHLDRLIDGVDILFGNEGEARALVGEPDVRRAVDRLAARCSTVVITRGAEGSVVATGGEVIEVPAAPVARVVDSTGAGDSFAAGFLYGVVRDLGPERSARLGSLVAGEIVSHLGARPQVPLAGLARSAGLID